MPRSIRVTLLLLCSSLLPSFLRSPLSFLAPSCPIVCIDRCDFYQYKSTIMPFEPNKRKQKRNGNTTINYFLFSRLLPAAGVVFDFGNAHLFCLVSCMFVYFSADRLYSEFNSTQNDRNKLEILVTYNNNTNNNNTTIWPIFSDKR